VVGSLRQSRAGHWFRNAHDEPVFCSAWAKGAASPPPPKPWRNGSRWRSGRRPWASSTRARRRERCGATADRYHAGHLNWRWSSSSRARRGLAWAVWWLWDYFPPASQPRPQTGPGISWLGLFRFPQVWGLVFAKFLSDAALVFLPVLAAQVPLRRAPLRHQTGGLFPRGFRTRRQASAACSAAWFSSRLIQRGRSLNFFAKARPGRQRGGDAADLFRDQIARADRHRAIQHCVCRAAILVYPGQ